MSDTITYLRKGRTRRATGTVIDTEQRIGMRKVRPDHYGWHPVWISEEEVTAAKPSPKQSTMDLITTHKQKP